MPSAAARVSHSHATAARSASPGGTGWDATADAYRGRDGEQFDYTCPQDGNAGSVWGTDVYTDDSSVCTAAVHAGRITLAQGGTVTIEIRPGQSSYTGSARNGITSSSYGSWNGSFVVLAGSSGGGGGVNQGGSGWRANASAYRARVGERFGYTCPANGDLGRVWGTDVYTDDSSVCTAAVHAGSITPSAGGSVTIEMRAGQSSYTGSSRNGVSSSDYGSWGGSFVVVGAPAGGGGGGGGGGGTIGQPGPLPAPKPGVAVNVQSAGGTILVKLPGQATFARLVGGAQVPVGATVDTTKGAIDLTSSGGKARFNGGLFKVGEPSGPGGGRITELTLQGGDFTQCPKGGKQKTASATPNTIVRELFGNGKGRFRTRGRFATAAIRGTRWRFEDRCGGTWLRVFSGTVLMEDFKKRKTVVVRAGQTYIARR